MVTAWGPGFGDDAEEDEEDEEEEAEEEDEEEEDDDDEEEEELLLELLELRERRLRLPTSGGRSSGGTSFSTGLGGLEQGEAGQGERENVIKLAIGLLCWKDNNRGLDW